MTPEQFKAERARLVEQRTQIVTKATDLARTCAGRAFTTGEEVDALDMKRRADDLDRQLADLDAGEQRRRTAAEQTRTDQKSHDDYMRAAIKALGDGLGLPDDDGTGRDAAGRPRSRVKAGSWAGTVADHMVKIAASTGVKALATGSIGVPAPLLDEVVEMATPPRRITDLLIDREALSGGNAYSYLRQVTRTNLARPVADQAVKPTSIYTATEIEDRVRVVAHLSEPFPERFLADYATLTRFLESEMQEGVLAAIEGQVVAGDGVDENMVGLTALSGTVAVPFSSNMVTTLRKARTQMELLSEVPTAWLFNPSDLEAIDLLRADGATGEFLVGGPSPAGSNIFGNLPLVASPRVTAGTAWLGDWRQVRLVVREELRLDADRSGERFTRNEVVMRAEGRYGVAWLRPSAFAEVTLTAA